MLKKIISLMLVACMLLTLGVSVSANGTESTLYLHVTEGTDANQIFVFVAVKNNPLVVDTDGDGSIGDSEKLGLAGFQLNLSYDSDKFTLLTAVKEGEFLGEPEINKSTIVWSEPGGLYTKVRNSDYMYEITGITDADLIRYEFRVNTANITEEDYGKDFEFVFTDTSTGPSNATLASGADATLDLTPAVYTMYDPRPEIEGLTVTPVTGLQYTGNVIDPKDTVAINTVDGDTVTYKTEPAEIKNAGTYTVTATVERNSFKPKKLDPVTVTVAKKDVKINVNSASKVYGEADPAFTSTNSGIVDGDDLGVTYKRVSGEDVGTYTITPIISNTNYKLTAQTGVLTIIQKPVTVTVNAATKVYGDTDPAFTSTNSGIVYGDDLGVTYTRVSGEDVGTYSITPAISNTNYELTPVSADLTISARPATFTAPDVYVAIGYEIPSLSERVKMDNVLEADKETLTPEVKVYETDGETEVTGTITTDTLQEYVLKVVNVAGLSANYTPSFAPGALHIVNKIVIDVTITPGTKVYGEEDPTIEFTAVDGSGADHSEKIKVERAAGEDVKDYAYSISFTDDVYDNIYMWNNASPDAKFVITKKDVTLTVNDATKVYGEADPAFSAVVEGLVGADTLNYTLDRVAGENVDSYVITATLGDNKNYNVTTNTPGNFEITHKPATITVNDATKVYGELDPAFSAVVAGLVGADAIDYTLNRVAGENVGDYDITAELGSNPNYDITVENGNFEITKKPVTVTVDAATKVYGDADPAFTSTNTEIIAGDDLGVTYSREEGKDVGTYTITPVISNTNYELTAETAEFTITKKPVTVTVNAATKVYGDTDPAFTSTNSGIVDGDDLGVTYTRVSGEDVGTYSITPAISNTNYELTAVAADLSIAKKPVKVIVDAKQKYIHNDDPVFTAKVEGLIGNDTLNYTLVREVGEEEGEYAITAVIGENQNYIVEENISATLLIKNAGRPSSGGGGGTVVVKPVTKPDSTEDKTEKPEDNQGEATKPSANISLKETAKETKFVAGYEDNTFRPDTNATRNDVVSALTALFNITDVENAPAFTDTEDSAVKDLAAAGVINGYEDGSFKGESDITRAEFVKLLAAALKLETTEDAKADFSDINDHWAAEFIKTFVGKGYLLGYPDGTFRPDNKITRAEMVVVITRVVGTVDSEAVTSFADLDDSHWAYSYIKNAAKHFNN